MKRILKKHTEGSEWIHQEENTVQWPVYGNKIMDLWAQYTEENFSIE